MVSRSLEFHAFGFSTFQSQGPIVFIKAAGASGHMGPTGFCTSTDVKKRLARLLDLRVSVLKFYPETGLNKFLRQGDLLASTSLMDAELSADEVYTIPPILVESLKLGEDLLCQHMSGHQLQKRLGACWLVKDSPVANLVQLCQATSTAREKTSTDHALCSGCMVPCSRCGSRFPVPGSRLPCAGLPHKCSCCRGDPEGIRIITRMKLALRFGAQDDVWESLCIRMRRAIKAGHAEAVRAIALARGRRSLPTAELDLAIRSRRAGVLASVLSCCLPDVIHECLKLTELHALAMNTFGGLCETKLFFADLRRRLSGAHQLIIQERGPLEIVQKVGWLAAWRQSLPKPARHLIWQFLRPNMSARICGQLAEVIAGIDGLDVKLEG